MNQIESEVYGIDMDYGCRQWRLTSLLSVLFLLLCISMTACEQKPPPDAANVQATAPLTPDARTEWVVLIDNSKSITAPEQVLIREATMLLADLVDQGDRVSLLTFGSQSRTAASVPIQNNSDRRNFQDLVRTHVDFKESYSDIRAGLTLLAKNPQTFFPTPNAHHVVLLLSDGLLEPDHQSTPVAYQEIKTTLQGPLNTIDLYTIALGVTGSQRNIPGLTPPLTGQQLMAQIAVSPERFTQAKQLDEVFDAILKILKTIKGLSISNETSATYRIDKTVETMTLIVRKRSVNGEVYTTSSDIQLEPPEAQGALPNSNTTASAIVYRNSDYQYFDLFVVRSPDAGEWKVTLKNGKTPQVLSKIDTTIELNTLTKPSYYLNESGILWAWLMDSKHGTVSAADYQIQAHLTNEKNAQTYLPFKLDKASGQYFLDMPESVKSVLSSPDSPVDLELEIKATQTNDPMFLRQTLVKTRLAQPLIEWKQTATWLERIPFSTSDLTFGGSLDSLQTDFHSFDIPPTLKLIIEAFDKDSQQYQPITIDTAQPNVNSDKLEYSFTRQFTDYRHYRYSYELTGHTGQGERTIRSPWFDFQIRIPWTLISITAALLLLLMHLCGRWLAKLTGQVEISSHGDFELVNVTPRSVFNTTIGDTRFKVIARRTVWFRKRLVITVLSGSIHANGRLLTPGISVSLIPRRRYILTFDQTEVALRLHVV